MPSAQFHREHPAGGKCPPVQFHRENPKCPPAKIFVMTTNLEIGGSGKKQMQGKNKAQKQTFEKFNYRRLSAV
jgi:hypothetical protein